MYLKLHTIIIFTIVVFNFYCREIFFILIFIRVERINEKIKKNVFGIVFLVLK